MKNKDAEWNSFLMLVVRQEVLSQWPLCSFFFNKLRILLPFNSYFCLYNVFVIIMSVSWSSCQSVSCSKYVHILFRLTAVMWSHLKDWVMSRLMLRNLLFTILSIYWRSVKLEANLYGCIILFLSTNITRWWESYLTILSCKRMETYFWAVLYYKE